MSLCPEDLRPSSPQKPPASAELRLYEGEKKGKRKSFLPNVLPSDPGFLWFGPKVLGVPPN